MKQGISGEHTFLCMAGYAFITTQQPRLNPCNPLACRLSYVWRARTLVHGWIRIYYNAAAKAESLQPSYLASQLRVVQRGLWMAVKLLQRGPRVVEQDLRGRHRPRQRGTHGCMLLEWPS